MDLHESVSRVKLVEDIVSDRHVIMIDAEPDKNPSAGSIVHVIGDAWTSQRKGKGDWTWASSGSEGGLPDYPTGDRDAPTPWRLFMDFVWSALEDAGLDPMRVKQDFADEDDERYGPLGMSSRARATKGVKSPFATGDDPEFPVQGLGGEGVEDDLFVVSLSVNSLGTTRGEVEQNLHDVLVGSDVPGWARIHLDNDPQSLTQGRIYVDITTDEPGREVGEIDASSFETKAKDPEIRRIAGKRAGSPEHTIDTDTAKPEDVNKLVRRGYQDWKGVISPYIEGPAKAEPDSDEGQGDFAPRGKTYPLSHRVDRYGHSADESKDPNLHASALLLAGYSPHTVMDIMEAAGMKPTLSPDQMAEIRAMGTAVMSEELVELVRKASHLELQEGCDQCQAMTINGVATHEHGCPNSWVNPATGSGYEVECFECGMPFTPTGQPHKNAMCNDCLTPDETWEEGIGKELVNAGILMGVATARNVGHMVDDAIGGEKGSSVSHSSTPVSSGAGGGLAAATAASGVTRTPTGAPTAADIAKKALHAESVYCDANCRCGGTLCFGVDGTCASWQCNMCESYFEATGDTRDDADLIRKAKGVWQ